MLQYFIRPTVKLYGRYFALVNAVEDCMITKK